MNASGTPHAPFPRYCVHTNDRGVRSARRPAAGGFYDAHHAMNEHMQPGPKERIAFWITLIVGALLVIWGIDLIRWLVS